MPDNERSTTPTASLPPAPPSIALAQPDGPSCAPNESSGPPGSKRGREDDNEATRHDEPTAEVGTSKRPVAQRSLSRAGSSHRNKRSRREIWIRTQDLALRGVLYTLEPEVGRVVLDRANATGVNRGHFCPQILGLQGALGSRIPTFIEDWARPDCTPSSDTLACYVHRLSYSREVFEGSRIVRTCLGDDHARQQLDEDADWIEHGGPSSSQPSYVMGWMDRYASGAGAKVAWCCECERDSNRARVFDSLPIEEDTRKEACDWYHERIDSVMARLNWQDWPTDVELIQLKQVSVAASAPAATLPVTAYILHLLADFDDWMDPNLEHCPAESSPQTLQSEWMMRLRIAQADFLQAGIGQETLEAIIDGRSEDG